MTHDQRFHSPMFHAEQLDTYDWRGEVFSCGDVVEYSTRHCTGREFEREESAPRLETRIVERWLEWWENGQMHLLYAECINAAGEVQRLWFHRDDVHAPSGFAEVGAVDRSDALW